MIKELFNTLSNMIKNVIQFLLNLLFCQDCNTPEVPGRSSFETLDVDSGTFDTIVSSNSSSHTGRAKIDYSGSTISFLASNELNTVSLKFSHGNAVFSTSLARPILVSKDK